jgi:hypothetical protein
MYSTNFLLMTKLLTTKLTPVSKKPELEFLKSLWGLGTEEE